MDDDRTVVVDTADGIKFFQMCARRGARSLEIKGMRRSGGSRTAYSICKSEYGLSGSRESVLKQMDELIAKSRPVRA